MFTRFLHVLVFPCLWPGRVGKWPSHQWLVLIDRINGHFCFLEVSSCLPTWLHLHASSMLLYVIDVALFPISRWNCSKTYCHGHDQAWGIAEDKQGLKTRLLVQISSLFSPLKFMCILMASGELMLSLSVCNDVLKWLGPLGTVDQPTFSGWNHTKTVVSKSRISKGVTLSMVDCLVVFLYFISTLSPRDQLYFY